MMVFRPHSLKLDADAASPLVLTGGSFAVQKMKLSPGAVTSTMAAGEDGGGSRPVGGESTDNIVCELDIRIDTNVSGQMDAELNLMQQLSSLLADIPRRTDGRMALDFRPPQTAKTSRLYVLRGSIDDLPMEGSGESLGWYHGSPVVKVTLICEEFISGEEVVLTTTGSTTNPETVVQGVPGDVPAEGKIEVIAATPVGTAQWGLEADGYDPASPTPVAVALTAITTSSKIVGTQEGSPVAISAAMSIPTPRRVIGNWYHLASSAFMEFRVVQIVGGIELPGAWIRPPGAPKISVQTVRNLDLGVIGGSTRSVVLRIDARAVDYNVRSINISGDSVTPSLSLLPASRFGEASSVVGQPLRSGQITGYDNFVQVASPQPLNGFTPGLGATNWSSTGSTTDFSVATLTGVVSRAAGAADATDPFGGTSPARAAIFDAAGSTTTRAASVKFKHGNGRTEGTGIVLFSASAPGAASVEYGINTDGASFTVYRRIGSTPNNRVALTAAILLSAITSGDADSLYPEWFAAWHELTVVTDGVIVIVYIDGQAVSVTAAINGTGTYAGFTNYAAAAGTTYNTSFRVWTPSRASLRMLNPIFGSSSTTESIDGTPAPAPVQVGSRVFLQPAGPRGVRNRIVTAAYASGLKVGERVPGAGPADNKINHQHRVSYRPRYRLPRGS